MQLPAEQPSTPTIQNQEQEEEEIEEAEETDDEETEAEVSENTVAEPMPSLKLFTKKAKKVFTNDLEVLKEFLIPLLFAFFRHLVLPCLLFFLYHTHQIPDHL